MYAQHYMFTLRPELSIKIIQYYFNWKREREKTWMNPQLQYINPNDNPDQMATNSKIEIDEWVLHDDKPTHYIK